MDKTPNYLNSVFRKATGVSIHQYINREKMRLAASLMEEQSLTFAEACENVGISDLSHGYRLFKRHMGVTPKEYLSADRLKIKT
jgi:two-component system response regulator YesN